MNENLGIEWVVIVFGLYRGYIWIMENKMEATVVYWGNIFG